jgi:DNA-binding NarL/FixJ family response regulator
MRFAVKAIISQLPEFLVVGEEGDGEAAYKLALELRPDFVVMDVLMPGIDGIEATRRIRESLPGTRVLLLTSVQDREHVLKGLTAGADGYCTKDTAPEELTTAIEAVASGSPWLSAKIAAYVYQESANGPAGTPLKQPSLLTTRELDVLKLVTDGYTNPQIASQLIISLETVKTHIRHILAKSSVVDRTQAAVEAMKLGLL